MYDSKVIRRRRAALAVFVALSIAILTAYFGESGGGFFHALQRGAQEAFAPIETGASRALKPVATCSAGSATRSTPRIRTRRCARSSASPRRSPGHAAQRDAAQLKGLVGLQKAEGFPRGTEPVAARVIAARRTSGTRHQDRQGLERRHPVDQPVIAAAADDSAPATGAWPARSRA